MKNFFSNIIEKFLPPPEVIELSSFPIEESFLSVSINKRIRPSTELERMIQFDDPNGNITLFELTKKSGDFVSKVYQNQREVSSSQTSLEDYGKKLSEIFQFAIEAPKNILANPSDISSTLESETRGLEWIKVTLLVLNSAIKKSIEDKDLQFEGQLFVGKRKPGDSFQIRIRCLSLDFSLQFMNDDRLRVYAWDYKNKEHDSKVEPTFKGDFSQLKQHVFNEFIQLLANMSIGSTQIK